MREKQRISPEKRPCDIFADEAEQCLTGNNNI